MNVKIDRLLANKIRWEWWVVFIMYVFRHKILVIAFIITNELKDPPGPHSDSHGCGDSFKWTYFGFGVLLLTLLTTCASIVLLGLQGVWFFIVCYTCKSAVPLHCILHRCVPALQPSLSTPFPVAVHLSWKLPVWFRPRVSRFLCSSGQGHT